MEKHANSTNKCCSGDEAKRAQDLQINGQREKKRVNRNSKRRELRKQVGPGHGVGGLSQ